MHLVGLLIYRLQYDGRCVQRQSKCTLEGLIRIFFSFHMYCNNLPGIRPCIRCRPICLMRYLWAVLMRHELLTPPHTQTISKPKDTQARVTAAVLSSYSLMERRDWGFPEVPTVVMISWVDCPISSSPFRQIIAYKQQSFLYVAIPFHGTASVV